MLLRTFKRTLVMLLVATGMTGCVTEYDGRENPMHSTSGELKITVNVPGQLIPTSRSIAGSEGESVVKNIYVLVFDGNGVLLQNKEGTIVTPGGNDFKCQLGREPNARTVVIVANVSNVAEKISEKSTKKDILAVLTHGPTTGKWNTTNSTNYTAIPMYGEKTVSSGLVNDNSISVELTRMLARVDVVLESTIPADTFTLDSVYVVNYNTVGNIAPSWDTNGNLTSALPNLPGSPGKKTGNADALGYKYSGTGLTGDIYLYEAEANPSGNPMTENPAHTNAICLIVKGKYKGTNYYYRIDFTAEKGAGQKPEDVQYMPVYRNHQYIFQISEVNGPGYKNFNDALKSFGVLNSLKTKLNTVNIGGITNMVFDGQHYIGLGDALLDYTLNSVNVPCITSYQEGWEIEKIEYVGPQNWLTAERHSASEIRLTSNTSNLKTTGAVPAARKAIVHIKAGRLTHKMDVNQIGALIALSVKPASRDFTYKGGSNTFSVTSSITTSFADGTQTTSAFPWIANFSNDDGTTWSDDPEWLTFPASSEGSVSATDYTAEVQTSPVTDVDGYSTEDNELRNSAVYKGSAISPYNLSTNGAVPTSINVHTANCYVVNSAGNYKLPLIYGNAIIGAKNPNSIAYNPPGPSTDTFLKPFKNHADADITGPYVYNHATPHDAVMVWMDWPELIVNVRLTDKVGSNYTYLAFDVPKATIAQGNAIVAVRDAAGIILWSWHIWVTAPSIFNVDNVSASAIAIKNYQGDVSVFMRYNLGWCPGRGEVVHGERSMKVRISQTGIDNPNTAIIIINQNEGTVGVSASGNPYWQFGRKDPQRPALGNGKSGQKATIVDGPGYAYPGGNLGKVALGISIQTPHIFHGSSNDWCDHTYNNLWNANNSADNDSDGTAVVKTIYDPCPIGFQMPKTNVWTGFTETGSTVDRLNVFDNSSFAFKEGFGGIAGYFFYTGGWQTGDLTFYPAVGYVQSNRNYLGWGTNGVYWASGPFSDRFAYELYVGDQLVHPNYNRPRYFGYSVRCVQE